MDDGAIVVVVVVVFDMFIIRCLFLNVVQVFKFGLYDVKIYD